MNSQWKLTAVVALKLVLFGGITSKPIHTFLPDATYEDIQNLNATCVSRDSCKDARPSENLNSYNCNCESFCTRFGTCCVDSKYITNKPTPRNKFKCGKVYGDGDRSVFMIDSCKSNWKGEESVRERCDSNGEELDDPLLIVPVTNPETRITYKNYFCYVCNDDSDNEEPVSWDVKLQSKSDVILSSSVAQLHYNAALKTWVIRDEKQNVEDTIVSLSVAIPESLNASVYYCLPDVISYCAWDWFDSSVRRKCHAYMAVARFSKDDGTVLYRNPHCAICNFENIKDMECFATEIKSDVDLSGKAFFVRMFTVHDKVKMCEKGKKYDEASQKCRKIFKG